MRWNRNIFGKKVPASCTTNNCCVRVGMGVGGTEGETNGEIGWTVLRRKVSNGLKGKRRIAVPDRPVVKWCERLTITVSEWMFCWCFLLVFSCCLVRLCTHLVVVLVFGSIKGDDQAGEAGDPYASIRGTIFRIKRPSKKMRMLRPGQKVRRTKPKVKLGRDCVIRNDGRR